MLLLLLHHHQLGPLELLHRNSSKMVRKKVQNIFQLSPNEI
jgi:hypothetical protein